MKKRLLKLTLLMMLFSVSVYAQKVTGKVTSGADGSPLPGVSVLLKGTSTGSATDADGAYSMDVPDASNGTLVFSFIGFVTQEVTIQGKTSINVTMADDATALGDIVVTALGITRESKSLSYAQQSVDGSALTQARDINFLNALSGRAAGVEISKSSSGPGGSTKIVLRGNKSLSGNSEPLFVIDGIPMANNKGGQPGMWGGWDSGDGMSQINQDDIESVSILRGSNAAALYGSQGANGVVIITTKKGKEGATKIDFNTGATFESVLLKPSLQFKYGAIGNAKESWSPTPGQYASNYVDDFFKVGHNLINSVAISGGTSKTTAYFSYGNVTATGISPEAKYNRNNITFKQSTKLFNDKVTVSSSVMMTSEKSLNRAPAGYYLNPLTGLYMFPRQRDFASFKDEYQTFNTTRNMYLQNWFVVDHHQSNPYWIINREPTENLTNRVISSANISYAITDKLNFSVRGNYDYALKLYEQKHSASSNSTNIHPNGSWAYRKYSDELIYTDGILTYKDNFGDISLNVIAGASYQKSTYGLGVSVNASSNEGLIFPNQFYFQNLNTNVLVNSTLSSKLIKQAVFGNASIGFKDFLFLDISGRNDWASSLAGTGNDSYFYPSVGLSGVIGEMVTLPKAITFAKVRASYTAVANEVPFNRIYPSNTINAGGGVTRNTTQPFNNLKPEKIQSLEIGANVRFLDDRLGLDVTYYNLNSKDQFITLPAPSGSGYTSYSLNAGEIVNKGLEVTLDATPVFINKFRWKTAFNFSKNTNTVVTTHPDLKSPITTGQSEGFYSRFQAGGSINDVYVYDFQKDAQGRIMLSAGDAPLKTADVVYAGNLIPKWSLGWSNDLSYGNFALSFLVNGKFGGVAFSQTESMLDGAGVSQRTADARDAGGVKVNASKNDVAVGTVDAQTWYRAIGDRNGIGMPYVYDRTTVRLTQLALSYNFNINNKKVFKAASVSLVGQNLMFFYIKAPFDPELAMSTDRNSASLDNFNLPATRNFGVNLKVTF